MLYVDYSCLFLFLRFYVYFELQCLVIYHLCLCVQQVLVFSESLVPTVRKALCDPLEDVREAAAKTFEQLHTTIGHQALDDILPALLKQLVRPRHSFLHICSGPLFILHFIF